MIGAGLFGFMINPPIALYYMQGLNTTPLHGHAAPVWCVWNVGHRVDADLFAGADSRSRMERRSAVVCVLGIEFGFADDVLAESATGRLAADLRVGGNGILVRSQLRVHADRFNADAPLDAGSRRHSLLRRCGGTRDFCVSLEDGWIVQKQWRRSIGGCSKLSLDADLIANALLQNRRGVSAFAFAATIALSSLICLTVTAQETGKRVFAHRIGNPCWASAIGVNASHGEKLVCFVLKNGFTVVLRPGDEYDQVSRNQLWDVEQMQAAADAAAEQRKRNAVPADQAKPKTGPEKSLAGMPEKTLHWMFSYDDPTVYAATIVEGNLLIRTGQHLYCVRNKQ